MVFSLIPATRAESYRPVVELLRSICVGLHRGLGIKRDGKETSSREFPLIPTVGTTGRMTDIGVNIMSKEAGKYTYVTKV